MIIFIISPLLNYVHFFGVSSIELHNDELKAAWHALNNDGDKLFEATINVLGDDDLSVEKFNINEDSMLGKVFGYFFGDTNEEEL